MKLGERELKIVEIMSLCSRTEYLELFFAQESGGKLLGINRAAEIDFVIIGRQPISLITTPKNNLQLITFKYDYICCPCSGKHLKNTSELKRFTINLQKPKKVGNNKFEFRFEVSLK